MMPWWRLLVTAAVILLPFAFSQATQATPPPSIDLKTLDSKDAYFVRGSCNMRAAADQASKLTKITIAENDQCDVILHTRQRGLKNLFVEIDIQHISSMTGSTELDATKSVKIVQGAFTIECKPDGTVVSSEKKISIVTPTTTFTPSRLYCAFIMGMKSSKLADYFTSKTEKPSLKYHAATEEKNLEYELPNNAFWNEAKDRCDPSLATTTDIINENGILYEPVEDINMPELKCSAGVSRLYLKSGEELFVDSISCGAVWQYEAKGVLTTLEDQFKAMCRTKHCSQCSISTLSPLPHIKCPTCIPPSFKQEGDECSEIKCDSNLWILDGKWMEKPTMQCSRTSQGIYKWNANGVEVTTGACTSEYNCHVFSALKMSCVADRCHLPSFNADNTSLQCNGGHIKVNDETILRSVGEVECNPTTGLYTNGTEMLPRNATVGCYDTVTETQSRTEEEQSEWIVPLAFTAVIVLIGIAAAIFIIFRYKKRKAAAKKRRDEAIAEAEEERKARKAGKNNKWTAASGQKMRLSSLASAREKKVIEREERKKKKANERARIAAQKKEQDDANNEQQKDAIQSCNSSGTNTAKDSKASAKSEEAKKPDKSEEAKASGKSNKAGKSSARRRGLVKRNYDPKRVAKTRDTFVKPTNDNGYHPRKMKERKDVSQEISMEVANRRVGELYFRDKPTTYTTETKSLMPPKDGGAKPVPSIPEVKKTQ